MTTSEASTSQKTPFRQIRANYDNDTITVYQAWSAEIGETAVKHQKLDASPAYSYFRMTWIKPSWTWMCYRAGYSYKDDKQARILAIKMRHEHFLEILRQAFAGHGAAPEAGGVRVQWDPERSPKLGKLEYRSIQIGIPRDLSIHWVQNWIVSIEDVTERARELKRTVEAQPELTLKELVEMELVPVERPYDVPDDIREILRMDDTDCS